MGTLLPDCPHGVGLCTDGCPRKLALERLSREAVIIVPEPCNCDDALALQAKLAEMKAERDKLLVRVSNLEWMRDNLRANLATAPARVLEEIGLKALPEAAAGSEGALGTAPQTGNGASETPRPAAAPGPYGGEFR